MGKFAQSLINIYIDSFETADFAKSCIEAGIMPPNDHMLYQFRELQNQVNYTNSMNSKRSIPLSVNNDIILQIFLQSERSSNPRLQQNNSNLHQNQAFLNSQSSDGNHLQLIKVEDEHERHNIISNLNNKIVLKHSKIYEDSQEDDDIEVAYYDQSRSQDNDGDDNQLEESLPVDQQYYEDSFEEEEKKLENDSQQNNENSNMYKRDPSGRRSSNLSYHSNNQQPIALNATPPTLNKHLPQIYTGPQLNLQQNNHLMMSLSPKTPEGYLMTSHFNSTGSNREWALETLLKEEKVNVKNLEDRNKALKDRIQNLENMLKSSINQDMSNFESTSQEQNNFTRGTVSGGGGQIVTGGVSQNMTVSEHSRNNSIMEDPHKQYLTQKVEQLQSLNSQYQNENAKLRARLDTVLARLDEFEAEKHTLRHNNNTKMNQLESKIINLEQELQRANRSSITEREETISQLQDHIRSLENQIYQQEIMGNVSSNNQSLSNQFYTQNNDQQQQNIQTSPIFKQSQASFGGTHQQQFQNNHHHKQNSMNSLNHVKHHSLNSTQNIIINDNDQYQLITSGVQNNNNGTQNWEEKVRQLEKQLDDTKQYYISKLQVVERQFKLNSANNTLTQTNNEGVLQYGERQKLFEQIAIIEEQRDQVMRQMKVLQIENDILQNMMKNSNQGQSNTNEVQLFKEQMLACMTDSRIIEFLTINNIIDNAMLNKNLKDQIVLLENMINQIDNMSQNQCYEQRQVNILEKLAELSLLISQMKEQDEIQGVLQKMKDIMVNEIQNMIVQCLKEENQIQKDQEQQLELDQDSFDEQDEDEYWSDFSDENNMVDEQEEKNVLQTLYNFQSWLITFQQQTSIDISKLLKPYDKNNDGQISLLDLQHSLIQMGFQCDYIQMSNLLKVLDQTKPGMVEYRNLFKNMKARPYSWWQEVILNNCFELRNLIKKDGNFSNIVPNKRSQSKYFKFYENLIAEKLITCNAISIFQKVFEDQGMKYLTKSSLRNVITSHQLPLTRQESHILIRMLEAEGKITKNTILTYLSNPFEFELNSSNSNQKQQSSQKPSKKSKQNLEYQELMQIIQKYLQENNVQIEEWFKCYDSQHNGTLDLNSFQQIFKSINMPLSRIEIYSVFKSLVEMHHEKIQPGSRIYFRDFIKQLKQVGQPDGTNPYDYPMQIKQQDNKQNNQNKTTYYQLQNKTIPIKTQTFLSQSKEGVSNSTVQTDNKENLNLNTTDYSIHDNTQSDICATDQEFNTNPNVTQANSKLEKCKNVLKIADLKRKIEQLVQKNSKNLQKSGLGSMSNTLSRASQMKINDIRGQYEKERMELMNQLAKKNNEIEGFSHELEGILKEMEVINAKQSVKKTLNRQRDYQ